MERGAPNATPIQEIGVRGECKGNPYPGDDAIQDEHCPWRYTVETFLAFLICGESCWRRRPHDLKMLQSTFTVCLHFILCIFYIHCILYMYFIHFLNSINLHHAINISIQKASSACTRYVPYYAVYIMCDLVAGGTLSHTAG